MKRKIAKVLVIGLIGLQLIGCSNQSANHTEEKQEEIVENTETSMVYFKDIDSKEYVVLGDYKGLEVVSTKTEVLDEDVDAYIDYLMSMSGEKQEVTDRDVVQNGDIANIDYEGKKDGVAFEGGTAQGYDLGIGSGSFIPGFEEGLIGVKKGETVDINLTFPENYHAADLAGEEVVFTVTVNAIYQEVAPEFNDAFVAQLEMEGITTVEEYRAYLKNAMEESEKEAALQEAGNQVLGMVVDNAKIAKLPQELVDKFYQIRETYESNIAKQYGMDLETYVSSCYGMDKESFEIALLAGAEMSAAQALVCLRIAEEESLLVTDEELNTAIEESYALYNYPSAEEFRAAIDTEEYRDDLLLNKVVDFLLENATITEVPELTE